MKKLSVAKKMRKLDMKAAAVSQAELLKSVCWLKERGVLFANAHVYNIHISYLHVLFVAN